MPTVVKTAHRQQLLPYSDSFPALPHADQQYLSSVHTPHTRHPAVLCSIIEISYSITWGFTQSETPDGHRGRCPSSCLVPIRPAMTRSRSRLGLKLLDGYKPQVSSIFVPKPSGTYVSRGRHSIAHWCLLLTRVGPILSHGWFQRTPSSSIVSEQRSPIVYNPSPPFGPSVGEGLAR